MIFLKRFIVSFCGKSRPILVPDASGQQKESPVGRPTGKLSPNWIPKPICQDSMARPNSSHVNRLPNFLCSRCRTRLFTSANPANPGEWESLGPPVQYTGCLLLLTNFCGSQQSQNHPKSVYKAMNLTSLVLHHCDRTTAVTMVVQMHCHLQRYLCHKTKKTCCENKTIQNPFKTWVLQS